MREMKGLSQAELAQVAGTTQPTLAKFEAGKIRFTDNQINDMSRILNINPLFYENDNLDLFAIGPNEILRMILPESRITGTLDFSFFTDVLAEVSRQMDVMFLSPEAGLLARIVYPIDIHIYSIAVRDNHHNIFIFRRRTASHLMATIVRTNELQLNIQGKATRFNHRATFSYRRIERGLIEAIRGWDHVSREDIEPLFDAPQDSLLLTEEEDALIHYIRERNIDTVSIMDYLTRQRQDRR